MLIYLNNVPCSKYNLEYLPDSSNLYAYSSSSFKKLEQSFDARRGGIYYGGNLGTRIFNLNFLLYSGTCEQQLHTINNGNLREVQDYFKLGKKCVLKFSDLPFINYNVVVTNFKNTSYAYIGSTIEVELSCYDGCGFTNLSDSSDTIIRKNSNLLPSTFIINTGEQTITSNSYYVKYNPGTIRTGSIVKIGTGSSWQGVLTISNATTGEAIRLNAHPEATTSDMFIDSDKHTIYYTNSAAERFPMLVHKDGWVSLEPGNKQIIKGTKTSSQVYTTEEYFDYELDETYIACLSGSIQPRLYKVTDNGTERVLTFRRSIQEEVSGQLELVRTNRLYISSPSSFTLNNFNITCTPRFE